MQLHAAKRFSIYGIAEKKGMVSRMEVRAQNYSMAEQYLNEVPRFTTKNPLEETKGFYRYLLSDKSAGEIREEKLGAVIHVAGTNGKGSVCAFLDAICRESGYHTGMFTSPHLVTTRERFRIDGNMVSEEEFVDAFNWLASQIDAYHKQRPEYQPTYFERLLFILQGRCRCHSVGDRIGRQAGHNECGRTSSSNSYYRDRNGSYGIFG